MLYTLSSYYNIISHTVHKKHSREVCTVQYIEAICYALGIINKIYRDRQNVGNT